MKYIDIHSHLNFPQYDEDREAIIAAMQEEKIGTITVGTNEKTSREAVMLARSHEHMWATVGVHPTEEHAEFPEETFTELMHDDAVSPERSRRIVAIGECGFDYFRNEREKVWRKQETLFGAHIEFAQKHDLPLILHIRPTKGSMDAYEDALAFLAPFKDIRGVAHFFVGTIDVAKQFLDLGFGIAFDGPITFTNEYNDAVRYVPQDFLFAETDAPFASPEPHRGKRNEPAYVEYIIEALARIRDDDETELREAMLANTKRIFDIA